MSENTEIGTISNKDAIIIPLQFLYFLSSLDSPIGRQHLINVIKGESHTNIRERQHDLLPEFGCGSAYTKAILASVLDILIAEDFVNLNSGKYYPRVQISEKGRQTLVGISSSKKQDLSSLQYSPFPSVGQVEEANHDDERPYDEELLNQLNEFRKRKAKDENVPLYVIAKDSLLMEIARTYSKSIDEMLSVKKYGQRIPEKYRNDLLQIVADRGISSLQTNSEKPAGQQPKTGCGPLSAKKGAANLEITLQRYWGYSSFHPLQKEVIEHLLSGSDVLLLMATGGGKSLCYQLPAVHVGGLSVVISPLIALMKDQVDDLLGRDIPAATINSQTNYDVYKETLDNVRQGNIRLLYVSPETFVKPSFLSILHTAPVSLIAIDEAHCISMWGHEFRTKYHELSLIREEFPEIPIIAMTATATQAVKDDIIEQLGMEASHAFIGSFNRPNLYYEIRPKSGQYFDIVCYLSEHRGQSGIIYCRTRKETESLAEKLMDDGFNAIYYHGGLSSDERRKRQEQFIRDEVDITCATIAFGMGIDKPDIRFVIHYDIPQSIEGYYQETGRAGRDNLPSDCILYYSPYEYDTVLRFIRLDNLTPERFAVKKQKLNDFIEFCECTTCRRKYLLNYFDEQFAQETCGACDNCLSNCCEESHDDKAHNILTALRDLDGRLSKRKFRHVINGYRGVRVMREHLDKEQCFGILKKYRSRQCDFWIDELMEMGCIEKDSKKRHLFITKKGRQVLEGKQSVTLSASQTIHQNDRNTLGRVEYSGSGNNETTPLPTGKAPGITSSDQSSECIRNIHSNQFFSPQNPTESALYSQLKDIQRKIIQSDRYDPTKIFNENVLNEIINRMPLSNDEFLQIPGMQSSDWYIYHDYYLETVTRFIKELTSSTNCQENTPVGRYCEKHAVSPPSPDSYVRIPQKKKMPCNSAWKSLQLYKEGHSITEIASMRKLRENTIHDHIASTLRFDSSVDIDEFIAKNRREVIEAALETVGDKYLKPVKDYLGDEYTYSEIKYVRAYLNRKKENME